MSTTTARLIGLLLSTVVVAPALAQDVPALPSQPHIVVVGTGEAEAESDYLELRIGVTLIAEDAMEATAEVERRLLAVVNRLRELGIDREHIMINPVNIDVEYDYDHDVPRPILVEAARNIDVTLHEINRYDEVVKAAIASGANTIGYPVLRSHNEEELLEQAQSRAIRQAQQRAESLARGFGRSLGSVYGIATAEARRWRWGSGGGGTLFGQPGMDPDIDLRDALTFTPRPVERRATVYAVFLLGPTLDSEDR